MQTKLSAEAFLVMLVIVACVVISVVIELKTMWPFFMVGGVGYLIYRNAKKNGRVY